MRPVITLAFDPARTLHVLPDEMLDRLSTIGELTWRTPLDSFLERVHRDALKRTEILLTGWGCPPIDATALDAMPSLKLIAHAAGTVKFFIDEEVYRRGIRVTHAAEANAIPVAEFTLAAILFANKRIFHLRDLYAEDRGRARTKRVCDTPIGNWRRTVGLVGASRIGRRVIDLLRPLDLTVLLADPFIGAEEARAMGVRLVDLPELFATSDVVSLHAPALPETRHIVGADLLRLMRDGATLINTARGSLVDEDALIAELETGRIDAMIDVTDPEIPEPSSRLYDLPNVFLTPHVAGAIGTERTRLGAAMVAEIERFVAGQPLLYAVDPARLEVMA